MAKLRELLAKGWNIAEIKTSISKEEIRIRLLLAQGRDRKFIEAVNDREILEYVRHVKKFQDAYGNNRFIYVDDFESYDKQTEELSKQGIVPKRPYKVIIGDTELQGVHLYHLLEAGPGGQHVGAAHFFVDLSKNPDFCQLDLRDDVKIMWADTNEIVFGGSVHEASYGDNSAVFLCYGGSRRLHQGRVNAEFIGIKPGDMLQFVASFGGIKAHFEGAIQPNLQEREFKVIFPIVGLKTPCDFKIQNTLFTPDLAKELPPIAKGAKTVSIAPWSIATSFAVTVLRANHPYQALKDAEKLVANAVNWLQLRTDVTVPCVVNDGIAKRIYYNLAKNYSRCRLVGYGLVVEQATSGLIFCQLDLRAGHALVFTHDPDDFLAPFAWIWNRLIQPLDKSGNRSPDVYQALNWLMRSFEMESPTDNLLQLWIALEFLCAKERVPRHVEKKDLAACIEAIDRLGVSPSAKVAVVDSIRRVNDPSLMERWDHLINTLGMKLTESEKVLIAKMRTERNKVTHGKKTVEISIEEIEKFRSILERVFLLKVVDLIEKGYAIPYLGNLFN